MPYEIERKFLVEKLPPQVHQAESVLIQQYYVSFEPEVRVRSKADQFFLTIKGQGDLVRQEVELGISEADYTTLKAMAAGQIIKTRYLLNGQEHTFELDIFDNIAGLKIVEVEFPSEEEANSFIKPVWFGKEVTHHAGYKNKNLARFGLPTKL